jgi:hypothetical protein
MKKIILSKGEGKTQQLIDLAAKTNAHIICADSKRAMVIATRAHAQGKDIQMPITFDDLIEEQHRHRGITAFLIDDADQFLQRLAGNRIPILALTMTP